MVVLASTAGALIGTFTGLIPGVHVNTAAAIMLGTYPLMVEFVSGFTDPAYTPILVSCCIMSASAVHSFVDFIPSVFIGVPDADNVASVLPGHRLLLQGDGMLAVRAAAIGSVIGSLSALALAIPLQWIMMQGASGYIDYLTEGVIVITLIVIMLNTDRPAVTLAMILVSGLLGYAVNHLDIPTYSVLGEGTLLFPLLTGLFGIPPLLEKVKPGRRIPQRDCESDPVGPVPGLKGVVTGLIAGWFPGVTATAGALVAASFTEERDPARFISMTASIGTVTSVFSIVTLSVSGSGRSGTCIVVKDIIGDSLSGFCSEAFTLILFSMAVASLLGYCSTVAGGKVMSEVFSLVPENLVNNLVLVLIVVLVVLFTGPFGLAILMVSATVGMIPPAAGISRVCLTGCLLIPVLFG
ncbi:MAG: tripartite tricarboxylate transporter permease [archaeon]|nr:tripartite tricarboxylate transporter permease [archaeon]